VTHEAWLADQEAPVLRLDSAAPVEDLVTAVLVRLEALDIATPTLIGQR
jgi:hypothetical protein